MFEEFKNRSNKTQQDVHHTSNPITPNLQIDDLASKRTNNRQPRSIYSQTHNQESKQESEYNKKGINFADSSNKFIRAKDSNTSDLFGQYKETKIKPGYHKDDHIYADNHKDEVKRSNHSYSNIFNKDLVYVDRFSKPADPPKMLPSVNYNEYREQTTKSQASDENIDKYQLLMENLSRSRYHGDETSSKLERTNEKEKSYQFEYSLKGDPFSLQKLTDEDIKKDFVKNGFQVISLSLERHTVTNKGIIMSYWCYYS